MYLDRHKMAEYFGISEERMIAIADIVESMVKTSGFHSEYEDLLIIDDEFSDPRENVYAKYMYGHYIGIIKYITHQKEKEDGNISRTLQ